ncbi:MAG: hypothetical protein J6I73_08045 [Treponema sp.]|nr:hypothetical protein [Treponema sp.]
MKIHTAALILCFTFFSFNNEVVFAKGKRETPASVTVIKKGDTLQYSAGIVKLILHGNKGTFQLYAVGRESGEEPVFSGSDNFTSTYFSLLTGKTEYRLSTLNGVAAKGEQTDSGVCLMYRVGNSATVRVGFEIVQSVSDGEYDVLKIVATVTNVGRKKNSFALKGVFDTVLGEKTSAHFSTVNSKLINSEKQYYGMENEKWILTQGDYSCMQLLLHGGDITPPEVVTLGNKDTVSLPLWIPVAVPSRSFDSVISYNNSTIAVNWPAAELAPSDSSQIVFYIALSADRKPPLGETYIASIDELYKHGDAKSRTDIAQSPVSSDWKLNPEYVQMLIDRINALDNNDSEISMDELAHLNAELNEIMERLERR